MVIRVSQSKSLKPSQQFYQMCSKFSVSEPLELILIQIIMHVMFCSNPFELYHGWVNFLAVSSKNSQTIP